VFISVDLNRKGYKSEPSMLAKHVAQMFYVSDITNKRLKLDIWSRIGGNASRRDQSYMNTRHKVLDWFGL
jgi:hypothetical protein